MVKEFAYRGKNLEELKALTFEQFAQLLPSRQRRSLLRQIETIKKFLAKCDKKNEKGKAIKTHSRSLIIVPQMIDLKIYVHSGKEFIAVTIIPEMLGHRLGEFVLTRKRSEHGAPGIGATRSSAFLSVK